MASRNHYHDHSRAHLLREIGWAIQNRVRDPRIPMIVSVTDLTLAADTRNATVYVNVFGGVKEQQDAVEALNHAAPFLQKVVSERVKLRHFPRLAFRLDHSIERGAHIEELLKEIRDDLA